ncbi:conserved domain protein [Streptococcus parauberis NCFD 2020]|uniref:Conserved domain protein n=2 Tax=Streptococcus parauberis TaxID=1348 RepID=F1Z1Y5_9STRE|nr:conserved domain protein [Streptococcus parauberis NCFD 2020]
MIKQVFFDLDGVIFDSYQIWDDLVNHLLVLKSLSLTN